MNRSGKIRLNNRIFGQGVSLAFCCGAAPLIYPYNAKSSLALILPIPSQRKGYPFEVALPPHLKLRGVILADRIKCLDWSARQAEWIETVDPATIAAVQARIQPLIQ